MSKELKDYNDKQVEEEFKAYYEMCNNCMFHSPSIKDLIWFKKLEDEMEKRGLNIDLKEDFDEIEIDGVDDDE